MDAISKPQVILVHDWLTGMRGGEKCLEVICRRWPDAPLFTLLHKWGSVSPVIERRPIYTSWLQRLPSVERYYRYLLPILPAVADRWRLPACELVVSFSHCVAKAVRAPRAVPHVCYCFTPMRYAWHQRHAYFGEKGNASLFAHLLRLRDQDTVLRKEVRPLFSGPLFSLKARVVDEFLAMLRNWDRRSAARVTHFVAISRTVQQRIAECYGRTSALIYPPVNTDFNCPAPVGRENYYLVVSALAPYKRIDLAIAVCNQLRRRLIIIGSGQGEKRLRALAGPTVQLLGWQSAEVLRDHFRRCRALLFPGEEDFGIVPVEAMACGAPVIAFGSGGATETVLPWGGHRQPTGLWFAEQTADCLALAIETFEAHATDFDPIAARRQALRFNQRRFEDEINAYLMSVWRPVEASEQKAA